MNKYDLGCGSSKKKGFIGVDILKLKNGADIIHNLNEYPYPIDDGVADEIWMDNVLEHLENPLRAMEEVWRICKNNAKVTVIVT